jgi:hypothetical protein
LVELELLLERGVNFGVPSGNLHWDIRPTASGLPAADASALLSGDIAAANINADAPNKTYVDLKNLSLPVTAGETLAIVRHKPRRRASCRRVGLCFCHDRWKADRR